jgi:hypothetical protein
MYTHFISADCAIRALVNMPKNYQLFVMNASRFHPKRRSKNFHAVKAPDADNKS